NDYFQLPDWNVNSLGGKTVTYSLPDEPWNWLEIVGAAHGALEYVPASGPAARLGARPQGRERTWHSVPERRGGAVRFNNVVQETPIQEIAAYQVGAGAPPKGVAELTYTVRAQAAPDMPALAELNTFVRGRRPAGERATVVALPSGAPSSPRTGRAEAGSLPFVNLMIPASFRDTVPGGPIRRFEYGWEGLDAGLDGLAIDIPALKIKPTHGGLVPLNVRIKDPLWPGRDLLDISVSVRPGEARTLWLDTRDRLLPEGRSLYLTVASAAPEFGTDDLDGMNLRLVFKPRAAALAEHENDRFQQVRDNMAFVVEEHPRDKRLALFDRLQGDLSDLLRANPEHVQGRAYWAEINAHQPAPAFAQPTPPAGVPLWAFRQVEDLKRVRQFVNWWIDERQAKNGEFSGGLSDDTDLLQQWPPLALMGVDPDKVKSSLNAMVEAVYANGMFTNGLSTIKTDELHAYEEGINGISEAMYLAYGEPKAVERLMATARAYPRIIQPNAAGHTHFVSNYFSGTDVSRESVWEWSKPYSYLVIHPAILLADFNGDPTMRKLITGLADGWLAHGDRQADGSLLLPAEINWRTDAERDQLATTPGGVTVLQLFWAAYRLSGDPKYLKPIEDWAARDISGLSTITADAVDLLGRRDSWGRTLTESAARPDASNFARYQAWRNTGDKSHLAALYGEEIKTADRRMYMVTEGHWWSDRVEIFSDLLQRSRLGGMALRRNGIVPGHTVSWRFSEPATAESVALLVTGDQPTRFKVVGFNLEDRPVAAVMTGWNVAPGRWRVTSGPDADGDDRIDGTRQTRTLEFQRTGTVDVSFAPKTTTVLEFQLETPGSPLSTRPDLGIGSDDVRVRGREAVVTVHSLGSVDAPAGTVSIEDASGRVVASAASPALRAPLDLTPKTAAVRLRVPAGFRPVGHVVRVRASGGQEITLSNNAVQLR
ncbi:MAG: LamG domain-containing protein, partial [Proteobacteria bacterium]|nr:LamG domain-containing protein [Pseudomonadota bacterium]